MGSTLARAMALLLLAVPAFGARAQCGWIVAAAPGISVERGGESVAAVAGAPLWSDSVLTGPAGAACHVAAMGDLFTIDFYPFRAGDFFSEDSSADTKRVALGVATMMPTWRWTGAKDRMQLPLELFDWAMRPGAVPETWLARGFSLDFATDDDSLSGRSWSPLRFRLKAGAKPVMVQYSILTAETGAILLSTRSARTFPGGFALDLGFASYPRTGTFIAKGHVVTALGYREFSIPFSVLGRSFQAAGETAIQAETPTGASPRWKAMIAAHRWLALGSPLLALESLKEAGIPVDVFFK